jgi:molecular chaperone GrpE
VVLLDKKEKKNDKPVKIDTSNIKISKPETIEEENVEQTEPVAPAVKPKSDKEKGKDTQKQKEPPKPKKTEVQLLKEEIEKLKKESAEAKEKNLYIQAELDNTRKHYIKQQDVVKNKTKIDIISEFMPIIDSLEYAKQNSEKISETIEDSQIITFLKGFNNLYQNVMNIFTKLNVKPIEALNEKFDYKLHEAIMSQENSELDEDTVIQVVAPGYIMNGIVIRPAKVIVSKKPAVEPEVSDSAETVDTSQEIQPAECNETSSSAENETLTEEISDKASNSEE